LASETWNGHDFTVLFFRGFGNLIGVTECVRFESGKNALYAVTHYRKAKVGGVYSFSAGLGLFGYYRFYLPLSEDVWSLPVGATHHWYRHDSSWGRVEEGPCRVVFPDPYALAASGRALTLPFSRHVFFLDPLN
jgi:hypothetical protein